MLPSIITEVNVFDCYITDFLIGMTSARALKDITTFVTEDLFDCSASAKFIIFFTFLMIISLHARFVNKYLWYRQLRGSAPPIGEIYSAVLNIKEDAWDFFFIATVIGVNAYRIW